MCLFWYICSILCTFRCDVWITESPVNDFLGFCVFEPQSLDSLLELSELRVLERRRYAFISLQAGNWTKILLNWGLWNDYLLSTMMTGCVEWLMTTWKSCHSNLWPTSHFQNDSCMSPGRFSFTDRIWHKANVIDMSYKYCFKCLSWF